MPNALLRVNNTRRLHESSYYYISMCPNRAAQVAGEQIRSFTGQYYVRHRHAYRLCVYLSVFEYD